MSTKTRTVVYRGIQGRIGVLSPVVMASHHRYGGILVLLIIFSIDSERSSNTQRGMDSLGNPYSSEEEVELARLRREMHLEAGVGF